MKSAFFARALAVLAALALLTGPLPTVGRAETAPEVVVSRAMTSNPAVCLPVDGEYYDWLELCNLSGADVDLTGWRLNDRADLEGAFALPQILLSAGGTLVVYCADAPEGYSGEALFTGFRLSADGEDVLLADAEGATVQLLSIPAMAKGSVYLRDEATGAYRVTDYASQLSGDPDGADSLCPAHDPAGVFISELMPVNRTVLMDGDGEFSDWIELQNGSDAPVNLAGWTLSDDDGDRRKWTLPDVTLPAGGYLIVFASGKDRDDPAGELHAGFKLAAEGEAVRLYDPAGRAVSWAEYRSAAPDASISRLPDGMLSDALAPTPGGPNGDPSAEVSQAGSGLDALAAEENAPGVYLNEILSSGEGDDWVEIAHPTREMVDLSGMGLSDDPDEPMKWVFPEGTLLRPGGMLVVTLTGADGPAAAEGLSAPFALSEGETLCLTAADGAPLDAMAVADAARDVSYGRAAGEALYRYFETPTPGAANAATSYARRLAPVSYSQPGGACAARAVQLTLSAEEGAEIRYTTDGSAPTHESPLYNAPLVLEKTTRVRAVAFAEDALPSEVSSVTYLPGEETALRVLCVWGNCNALNTGNKGSGSDVFAEFYGEDGAQQIAQECLFKLSGHGSRVEMAQKAFSLRARKEYGDGWFRAALFTGRDYDRYKSVVLRASGQDGNATFMMDSILTSLAADTGVYYQETEVCRVYINGEYWGVYNLRERGSPESLCQFHGWADPDSVNLLEGSGSEMSVSQGSGGDFKDVLSWARNHDLSDDRNVALLGERVDIDNLLNYAALQIYVNNQDLDNVRCYNNPAGDGKWRWVLYDLDLAYQVDHNTVRDWLRGGMIGSITRQDNTLFSRLMKNDAVRERFLRRMGELLSTTFSAEGVIARIDARCALLEPEMERHCRRWGWSVSTWKSACDRMRRYALERPVKLRKYLISAFGLTEAEAEEYLGAA